ncbi:MAG: phosphoribosylamine--glycine ligase [Candidatus Omnitrophica bacterium]|nr:phosphoribosylamine--glycine ligase [Candidatus Omnitrophota bacterium]
MNVLVIGSGGREHALCWKISRSTHVKKIYCAPGNAGTSQVAENINIPAEDLQRLLVFAQEKKIDLVVVGPEIPLVAGIVDLFTEKGIKTFGPSKKAAQLEASKIFSKEKMKKYKVETASFKTFTDADQAKRYIKQQGVPIVIKADGLAAGKGVIVALTEQQAEEAVDLVLVQKAFGQAGKTIVIEEFLEGEEASILVISDGDEYLIFDSSQDFKRALDNDKGPNTGGMGAYSPVREITKELLKDIEKKVVSPMIKGLRKDGITYKGILYAGIMLTKKGPKVLEFNVRFGDPETQSVLPRMKTDLVELMLSSIEGTLGTKTVEWDPRPAVGVVLAAGGYPGKYEKGKEINGLNAVEKKDSFIFHAGTKEKDGKIITNGGRVMNVVAFGDSIKKARENVYKEIDNISFENMQYRKDIALRAASCEPRASRG